MLRHTDDGWTVLETRVVSSTDDEVRVAAETPGFSYFALVEDDGTLAVGDEPAETAAPDDEPSTDDGSQSIGVEAVLLVVALAAVLLFVKKRDT